MDGVGPCTEQLPDGPPVLVMVYEENQWCTTGQYTGQLSRQRQPRWATGVIILQNNHQVLHRKHYAEEQRPGSSNPIQLGGAIGEMFNLRKITRVGKLAQTPAT